MKKNLLPLLVFCGLFSFNAHALDLKKAPQLPPEQVTQIEQVVHDYLLKNPHILIEVAQKLQEEEANRENNQVLQIKSNIQKYKKEIFSTTLPSRIVTGNPNGKFTLVEVIQYQCPHCKVTEPLVEKLIKDNPDLKVIIMQWPFFGNDAIYAAKLAFAATKQGKFLEVHNALMHAPDPLTKDAADKIVAAIPGLNMAKLKADMDNKAFDDGLKADFKLSQTLNLIGTPTFIFGNKDLSKFSLVAGQTKTIEADLPKALSDVR